MHSPVIFAGIFTVHQPVSKNVGTFFFQSGKTCIANYLSESISMEEAGTPRPTQGARIVEFELSHLNVNDKQCKVEIEMWDCSGDHK